MHRVGLIHQKEWVRPKAHSVLVPVWSGGPGKDATPEVPAYRHVKRRARNTAILIATVREVLEEPCSILELAEELGVHRETCSHIVGIMKENRLVYVKGWLERANVGGPPTSIYAFGAGRNVARPAPRYERCRKKARVHAATHYAKQKHIALMHAISGAPRSVFDVGAADSRERMEWAAQL